MIVFFGHLKNQKNRDLAAGEKSLFFEYKSFLRNCNFRLAVGGPFQASNDQFSWSWIELKRNWIEFNWNWIDLKLNWNVVNWNWNWIEVNRIDLKLNWFVEIELSWYRHELIRIDVDFDFGFNWIELKYTWTEAGWNWI